MYFSRRLTLFFLVTIIISFLLFSCGLFKIGPVEIVYSASSLTLSWDDDADYIDTLSSVDYYNVYYRQFGALRWIFFDSTKYGASFITINKKQIGTGEFEFGVEAVNKKGAKSEIHASTDFSAWPSGGWYVKWE